ncbi:uncharacterized protein BDZ99DRAFT_340438, partial [Mytilinidion resinicola]
KEATENLKDRQACCDLAFKKLRDHRDYYHRSLAPYFKKREDRPRKEVQQDFDNLHLSAGQKITAEIKAAQEALRLAKQNAKALGVWISANQTSQFGDHPDDGYRDIDDRAWISDVGREIIENWMD